MDTSPAHGGLSDIRRRIHDILAPAGTGGWASKVFEVFIFSLILLNVAAIILASVASVRHAVPGFFRWFEEFSVAVFTVEYVLRLWTCTLVPRFARPVRGRLRFALTPFAIIDLMAILPFYLPFVGVNLRSIRVVRLFRLFRAAKLARYSRALQLMGRVIMGKKEELITALLVLLMLLILSASLMYFAETEAQPAVFSSIPAAMWWAVTTLTTVGYGDAVPVTIIGKILAALIEIIGIGMFALPAGVLGAGFVEEMQNHKKGPTVCPHCGKEIGPA